MDQLQKRRKEIHREIHAMHCVGGFQATEKILMEVTHPKHRFSYVAIDIQSITLKTKKGKWKVVAMVDFFTIYVSALPVPDEKAEKTARIMIVK